MLKTIKVTVVYPQSFTTEIETEDSIEAQRDSIKDQADYYMETSGSDPIITDCSESELVE